MSSYKLGIKKQICILLFLWKKSMCDVSVTVISTKCMDQLKKKLCTFILGAQSQLNLLMGKIAELF